MKFTELTDSIKDNYLKLGSDEKLSRLILDKALSLKGVGISETFALYFQNPEEFSNLKGIIPQRDLFKSNFTSKENAKIYYLPQLKVQLSYQDGENWRNIANAPEDIKIAINKNEIPTKENLSLKWDIFYNIDETTMTEIDKKRFLFSPIRAKNTETIYNLFSSYAKNLGINILEENLNAINLNSFFDKSKLEIKINSSLSPVEKTKSFISSFADFIVTKTSTQPQECLKNEQILLNASLNKLCGYQSDLSGFDFSKLNESNTISSIFRAKRATDDISSKINEMFLEQSQVQNTEIAQKISQNFMQDI